MTSKMTIWGAKDVSIKDISSDSQKKEAFLMVGAAKINSDVLFTLMYISHRVWKYVRNMHSHPTQYFKGQDTLFWVNALNLDVHFWSTSFSLLKLFLRQLCTNTSWDCIWMVWCQLLIYACLDVGFMIDKDILHCSLEN